jgi:hypothetical protein
MAETPEIGGKTEELVLHGEEHGSGTLPQLDTSTYPSQLLWLVIVFGALYLLLSKVLLPKIANALETRQSRIAADLAQAEQLNDDARKASEAYDAALADARAKANAIAQENRGKSSRNSKPSRARSTHSWQTSWPRQKSRSPRPARRPWAKSRTSQASWSTTWCRN